MPHKSLRRARLGCCALLLAVGAPGAAQAGQSEELIWPRIAAGMRLVDGEQAETVLQARRYAREPEHFAQMLARSEPFLWYIVEAVELREMPLELALIPAVESGFNPHAGSRQRARGLWQFLPATGADYGLRETVSYDAKRDPIASTRAALRYLDRLKLRFDQDWLLAIAAYNAGETRVSRARAQSGARPARFWDLAGLPPETRDYVPRLLGVALLVREPARFGVELPPIFNRQGGEIVALDRPRNLQAAAVAAGVQLQTLNRYNPGLKQAQNSGAKKNILLPKDQAVALRRELATRAHPPVAFKLAGGAAGNGQHVVTAGDTLWQLARRYGVSVTQLADWNELDSGAQLRVGRVLSVAPRG